MKILINLPIIRHREYKSKLYSTLESAIHAERNKSNDNASKIIELLLTVDQVLIEAMKVVQRHETYNISKNYCPSQRLVDPVINKIESYKQPLKSSAHIYEAIGVMNAVGRLPYGREREIKEHFEDWEQLKTKLYSELVNCYIDKVDQLYEKIKNSQSDDFNIFYTATESEIDELIFQREFHYLDQETQDQMKLKLFSGYFMKEVFSLSKSMPQDSLSSKLVFLEEKLSRFCQDNPTTQSSYLFNSLLDRIRELKRNEVRQIESSLAAKKPDI